MPYNFIFQSPFLYFSSSKSMISESFITSSSFKKFINISATLEGFIPKTPECIFTPDGIPIIGIFCPTVSNMSLAVPSPPQKIIKSIFFSRNNLHAFLVSIFDVIFFVL